MRRRVRQRRGPEKKMHKWEFSSVLVSCAGSSVSILFPCWRLFLESGFGGGGSGGGTILTSVDNSIVKELKLELSFILTLCTGHYFSCSAHRNMKADKTKPHSQGHTANKTQWDLRSDNWDQNLDFTYVIIIKSLNILRSLFSYLLNGYNNEL